MRRLNAIRLTIGRFQFGGDEEGSRAVRIEIDGENLFELIQLAGRPGPSADEVKRAPGLHPIVVAPPSQHWLGVPDPEFSEDSSAVIYDCECGHWECGGVLARIWVISDQVAWSGFRGPRGGQPYSVGPFHFERREYEQQLQGLRT